MRPILVLSAASAFFLSIGPSGAFQIPDSSPPYRTDGQLAAQYADNQSQPYAMNYADEAARALGISNGRWEAFDTASSDPLVPSFKGDIDKGGAMLKLQWRSGQ